MSRREAAILHVDMDAFYASVAVRDRPELQGRPVIVGGRGARAVVLSATYPARGTGVSAGMPMTRARRLCPTAVVLEADHSRYAQVSAALMKILDSMTPLVEPLGLDEAFLDVAGARRLFGSPVEVAVLVRELVATELGLPCSVGIGASKLVAKIASAQAKPDGLLAVDVPDTLAFLHPLPVAVLWGVGEVTRSVLDRLGLRTVGDIAHTPKATLTRALGTAMGVQLYVMAWGRDDRPVLPVVPDHSMGAERTFDRDIEDPVVVRRTLLWLVERVASRLRATGSAGRTVVLKVRFADLATVSRSQTLAEPTDVGHRIYATVVDLYLRLRLDRARIRLVGVRVEGLVRSSGVAHQLALDEPVRGWREAEQAADRASRRFGSGAVRPASLVRPTGLVRPAVMPGCAGDHDRADRR